jgi:hypothetical protein
MRHESAVNSAEGDDVALAKSFIIACEGPVLNWYSLLQLHSVCSWVDLKTKFIQEFQISHETTAQSSDCITASRKTGSYSGTLLEGSCSKDLGSPKEMIKQQFNH